MCVETPEGRGVVGPGETAFVPEGVPHMLTSIGAELRRSLVIVLHDTSRPASAPAHDVITAIERLAELHARGILSDAEFAAKKAELLGRI